MTIILPLWKMLLSSRICPSLFRLRRSMRPGKEPIFWISHRKSPQSSAPSVIGAIKVVLFFFFNMNSIHYASLFETPGHVFGFFPCVFTFGIRYADTIGAKPPRPPRQFPLFPPRQIPRFPRFPPRQCPRVIGGRTCGSDGTSGFGDGVGFFGDARGVASFVVSSCAVVERFPFDWRKDQTIINLIIIFFF